MHTPFESLHRARFRGATRLVVGPLITLVLCVSLSAVSKTASGQGFFFGPGFGVQTGGWRGGFGVAPSRIDISIGVRPSYPYPIGVPPSRIVPHPLPYMGHGPALGVYPGVGVYPDYRSQYTLRVLQAHHAQLEFAEAMGFLAPLPQSPLNFPSDVAAEPFTQPIAQDDWPAITPEDLQAVEAQMVQAASRLDNALARRGEEGEIWRQYLSTELIVASPQQPLSTSEWTQVLQNFDGVVANSDLRWVMRSDGFAETRQWVSTWVKANAADTERLGGTGNDETSPPPTPRPPTPRPPTPQPARPQTSQPADTEESSVETLPAPERARL